MASITGLMGQRGRVLHRGKREGEIALAKTTVTCSNISNYFVSFRTL